MDRVHYVVRISLSDIKDMSSRAEVAAFVDNELANARTNILSDIKQIIVSKIDFYDDGFNYERT